MAIESKKEAIEVILQVDYELSQMLLEEKNKEKKEIIMDQISNMTKLMDYIKFNIEI